MCDHLLGDDCFHYSVCIMSLQAFTLYHLHGWSFAYEQVLHMIMIKRFWTGRKQFEKLLEITLCYIDDIDVYFKLPSIG